MRSLFILAAVAAAVAGAAAPAMAASGVTPVGRHQQHYVNGRVPPYLRGFDDPGYAYHGNINGCAEDLGYGRWESCDYRSGRRMADGRGRKENPISRLPFRSRPAERVRRVLRERRFYFPHLHG